MTLINVFTFRFHSNSGHNRPGFQLEYSAETLSPLGCIPQFENNTDYVGIPFKLNFGRDHKKPDMEACRSFCKSFKDAKYFRWNGPEFKNINGRQSCTCKSAVGMKRQKTGVFSGEVHCLEDDVTKGDAESKITTASTDTSVPEKPTTHMKQDNIIEEVDTTITKAATTPSKPEKTTNLEEYTTTGDVIPASTSASSSLKSGTSKTTLTGKDQNSKT